jgi:hypothetical protein
MTTSFAELLKIYLDRNVTARGAARGCGDQAPRALSMISGLTSFV